MPTMKPLASGYVALRRYLAAIARALSDSLHVGVFWYSGHLRWQAWADEGDK
jgi:hypothetical protein